MLDNSHQIFSVLAPELPSLERRNWLIHLHYVRKEYEVHILRDHSIITLALLFWGGGELINMFPILMLAIYLCIRDEFILT